MHMRMIAVADDDALQMRGIDDGQRRVRRPQHFGAVEAGRFIRVPCQAAHLSTSTISTSPLMSRSNSANLRRSAMASAV